MWKSFFKQWKTSNFVTMVLPLFIAIPLIGMGFLAFREDRKFEQTGITATAVIGDTWINSSEEGSSSYYIGYTFEVSPGEEVYSEAHVSSSSWSTYMTGKEIEIVYLSNRATKSRIVREGGGLVIVWLFFGSFSIFIAFVFFLLHYRKSKKFLSLYTNGIRVKAEVVSIEKSNTWLDDDVLQKRLKFKYEDADGEIRRGRTDWTYPSDIRYKIGDSIEIFYDPLDPSLCDLDKGWEWKNNS